MRPPPDRRRRAARDIRERRDCAHLVDGVLHQVVGARTDAAASVLLVRHADGGGWHQVMHPDDVLDRRGQTFIPLAE